MWTAVECGTICRVPPLRYGPQLCNNLEESAEREWLVADGCGGYAMGTVSGLRTRRYHGLQVVSTGPPGRRQLGLAALDPVVSVGDTRVRLAVHEWVGGIADPLGHKLLQSFAVIDGVPRWRWLVDGVLVERELAMTHGSPVVGIVHRILTSPGPVRLDLSVLCTWRDAHAERYGDVPPHQENVSDGFIFEGAYRVRGPAWYPDGTWYRGVYYRQERARGLPDNEDLWSAGTFSAVLGPGESMSVEAWASNLNQTPPPAEQVVQQARGRARLLSSHCQPDDEIGRILAVAADQMIIEGPAVVAGYPWFGEWSRDTLTSYEGLFLTNSRWEEGRALLLRELSLLSEGMLANTADTGSVEFNTADASLWLIHALGRHVAVTGDIDLAGLAAPHLEQVVERHTAGVRHNIKADPSDALLSQGEEGLALTWMDARVEGRPVTSRAGKAVEINALWINALFTLADIQALAGRSSSNITHLARRAQDSFLRTFCKPAGIFDVVNGGQVTINHVRPNQLLAVSLPHGPLRKRPEAISIVAQVRSELLTPLGLRSLSPKDPSYQPRHQGGPVERDLAYHQGTVWPWLIGSFIDACESVNEPVKGVLDGLVSHLGDWGVGSVSETADGDAPHRATGCPFQAWSIAELARARSVLWASKNLNQG